MNITKEHKDELNAIIRIQFVPEDYQPKIDQQLREYSKKVSMPGFRPGKVPAGMVKKMYGKSILVDELNKLTSDSLFGYIRDNQIDILGNPLPAPENDERLDLENPGHINLAFEIGLAPQFDLEISSKKSFEMYVPLIDDEFISKEIENYRDRLGDYSETETTSTVGDLVHGVFTELNEDGSVKEGGISRHTDIHDADLKEGDASAFVGMKKGDLKNIDVKAVFVNPTVIAAILAISTEEVANLTSMFSFQVETVRRKEKAEVNQDFFDKLFGADSIFSEEELKNRIASDSNTRFQKDAETRFFNEVVEDLVKNSSFILPDDFLKRWLSSTNEGKVSAEDIEENYNNYAKGIRWQLIENKLIRENEITVTREQAIDSVANDFLAYMGGAVGAGEEGLAQARSIAERMLQNEKEANKVFDRLYNEALNKLFLEKFTIQQVALPFEDWVKKVSEPLN
jgi:trigger factor